MRQALAARYQGRPRHRWRKALGRRSRVTDNFALVLIHFLLVLAAIRLTRRVDLDREASGDSVGGKP